MSILIGHGCDQIGDQNSYERRLVKLREEIQNLEREIYFSQLQKMKQERNKELSSEDMKYLQKVRIQNTSKDCSVCLNVFCQNDVVYLLPCQHMFHTECSKEWLKSSASCPNCRFDLKNFIENKQTSKDDNDTPKQL